MSLQEDSVELHKKLRGKIAVSGKAKIKNIKDLSLLYTPGVAEPCLQIAKNRSLVYDFTNKWNNVAIVTDGSRVLGLGDIGPEASLPVMEGKALIMKEFADIDAFPICLKTKDANEIVKTIRYLEPVFGAINLEDIETPKVFEIERRLTHELNIPVFHDDQHGTAMVTLAALYNALKITKKANVIKIVVVGAGAAGYAIMKLLLAANFSNMVVFDSHGAIGKARAGLEKYKEEIAELTNKENYDGLLEGYKNADIIIAASSPGSIPEETIKNMKEPKIVFALANPIPEISFEDAKRLGVAIYGSGRSDAENQINNALCFPGFLRALLDLRIVKITPEIKIAAAQAIADSVTEKELKKGKIVPDVFDKTLVKKIKGHVAKALGI